MRRGVMIATIAVLAVAAACSKDKAAPQAGPTDPGSATAGGSGSAPATAGSGASGAAGSAMPSTATPVRPSSITDDQVKIADAFVTANDKLAHDVAAAGTDCKQAAAAVTANAAPFGAAADAADALRGAVQADPEAKRWFQAVYVPKMMAAQGVMTKTAQACMTDPAFKAALAAVQIGGPKTPAPTPTPPPPPPPPAPAPP